MSDDADTLYSHALELEAQARELDAQARALLVRAMRGGSLDALHGCVRRAVAERDYDRAVSLLNRAKARFGDVAPERLVSVAPDVLGRDLPLDSDDASDLPGAGTFTVITPDARQALDALGLVAERLLQVDESGGIQPLDPVYVDGQDPPYTASYLAPLEYTHFAVQITLDTDGEITAAMGRTMVAVLVEGLVAARTAAHVCGYRPDLHRELAVFG